MADDLKEPESRETVWKRLARLFRSGPVVRHKIAAGERMMEPRGSASPYKKELSNQYVHALASYGQFERVSRYSDYAEMEQTGEISCLTIDSVINTPAGDFTIEELLRIQQESSEERWTFPVYCFDESTAHLSIGNAHSIRKTKRDLTYVVELDSGEKIRCTKDHLFLTRDGKWKQAQELSSGDSLMPFYRKGDKQKIGYSSVYTIGSGWKLEHRFVAEKFIVGRDLLPYPGEVVHHKDLNKRNNSPSNLQVCSAKEHNDIHGREWSGYTDRTREIAAKISKANKGKTCWCKGLKGAFSQTPEAKNKISKSIKELFEDPEYKKRALSGWIEWQKSDEGKQAMSRHASEMNKERWKYDTAYRQKMSKIFSEHAKSLHATPGWTKNVFAVKRQEVFDSYDESIRKEKFGRPDDQNGMFKSSITNSQILTEASKYDDLKSFIHNFECGHFKNDRTKSQFILRRLSKCGFRSWNHFKSSYVHENHKVVSVTIGQEEDVYDLTVDVFHNFACNGVIVHNSAIDIWADEATSFNEDGAVINIKSKNQEIKQILETLFFDILNIEFNLWSWARNLVKFGDLILFVDASESNGILNLLPIPINEIEREEGYDKQDPFAVRFRWLTQGNMILENWQVIHFRLLGNDNFLPYGSSIIEPARRIWRQLILIEDAMLVYRIVRSPERRVFKIDVGNIPPDQIDAFMEEIKKKLRRNQVVDPSSGRVDLRYNPLPIRQNTVIPLLDGRELTIKQLAEEFEAGKTNWVYSIQDGTKKVVPGKVTWCGKNYTCDELHRVWLDDGTFVDTAPEHPFLMRDGTSKRADKLQSGDSVMSVYRDLNNRGYERLVEPDGKLTSTHVMVARDFHKEKFESTKFPVVHHKTDLGSPNKRNNDPDRLQVMNFWEHKKFHADHTNLTLNTPERLAERRVRRITYNKSPEKRAKTSEQNRLFKKAEKMGAAYNGSELHKSHNEIRRAAQLSSWSVDKEARSESMRWIIPNDVVSEIFSFVKSHPGCTRVHLQKFIDENESLKEKIRLANAHSKRGKNKFHWTAVLSKLIKQGELAEKAAWVEFREYVHTHEVPVNHQVVRVEVLSDVDDVYCMTVVGAGGEQDRHNFGVNSNGKPLNSLTFVLNSVDEDFFLPTRGDRSSTIETLPGGQFTGDVEDVQYIQNKLFAALKVPKAHLGYSEDLGSKATLAAQDVRFARSIERVQKIIVSELNKIAIIHLFLLGYSGEDLVDFTIELANASSIAEQQKLELWRMKFEIASTATEGMLDRDTIYKTIFKLSDDQIEKVKEGKRADKLEDLVLEAMQAPPEATGDKETGGEEDKVPGEEELPQTLGGAPGGEAQPEPEGQPAEGVIQDGLDPSFDTQVDMEAVEEKKNVGSEGDDSSVDIDRGHDPGAIGQDLHTHVFGTKKQSASDPHDLKFLKRFVTRPFSESSRARLARESRPARGTLLEDASRIDRDQADVDSVLDRARAMADYVNGRRKGSGKTG